MTPPEYIFLQTPAPGEAAELERLYRLAGWLEDGESAGFIPAAVAGSTLFAVAKIDGVIIGMARAISDNVSDAYIQDVAVDPAFRRGGIGANLVKMVVSGLKQRGIDWIALVGEPGTEHFYETLGFKPRPGHRFWLCCD